MPDNNESWDPLRALTSGLRSESTEGERAYRASVPPSLRGEMAPTEPTLLDRAKRVPEAVKIVGQQKVGQKLDDLANFVTLPHDVYQGQTDPLSPQGMERAGRMAQTMAGLGLGTGAVVAPHTESTLGMFLPTQLHPDGDTVRAWAANKQYMNPQQQWLKYGINENSMGVPVFEIPDNLAAFPKDWQKVAGSGKATIKDVYQHPELMNAIRGTADTPVHIDPKIGPKDAYYDPTGPRIGLGTQADPATVVHELQHAVQHQHSKQLQQQPIGGGPEDLYRFFQQGHAPTLLSHMDTVERYMNDPSSLALSVGNNSFGKSVVEAFQKGQLDTHTAAGQSLYVRQPVEVEARNAENRASKSPDVLKNMRPETTEDIPRDWHVTPQYVDMLKKKYLSGWRPAGY